MLPSNKSLKSKRGHIPSLHFMQYTDTFFDHVQNSEIMGSEEL